MAEMQAAMSRLILLLLSFLAFIAVHPASGREEVTLLAPAFGDNEVGRYVGTLLNLKIWRSVTFPPEEDNNQRALLPVKVEWSTGLRLSPSFTSAEHLARQEGVRLVLWGIAHWDRARSRRCAEPGVIDCRSGWERASSGQPLAKDRLFATGWLHPAPVLQGQSRRNAGDLCRA
jgi:hypothetical protein